MTNRIKFLTVLVLGCMGLSGCVVVDDEFPVYSSYSYRSYDTVANYYPQKPKHYISQHMHHANVHKKDHHFNKLHHIHKAELLKHISKPDLPAKKVEHPIKQKTPVVSHQPTPQQDVFKEKKHPDFKKEHKPTQKNSSPR